MGAICSADFDGIDGEKPYWVHIGRLEQLKGDGEVLPHDDFEFHGYIVTEWIDEKGKVLRNSRGTSAFVRHTNYRPVSHAGGAKFLEIMDFNLMFTQLCFLRFKLCERKDGVNGLWDHSYPLAITAPSTQLMELVKNEQLGVEQTLELRADTTKGKIGMRMTFTVGDSDVPKPMMKSAAMKDVGNGPVNLLKDRDGDGDVDAHDAGIAKTVRPRPLKADSRVLKRNVHVVASEDADYDL